MKKSSYMTRAMRARDPRYVTILGKLGYERTDLVASEGVPEDDLTAARAEYQEVVGKRPYHGWDAAMLRAKIAEAKA